jgi:hypothetical protein
LLLLGKTKSETGEPWPVIVPGEDKPVSSCKIGEYVNAELCHYWQFYTNTKHAGLPFAEGWTQWPAWVPQLLAHFDHAADAVRAHNEREAYRNAGVKHG